MASSNSAEPRLAENEAIVPVNYSKVTVTGQFWKTKQDRVSTASLPAGILQTEDKTPRIRNFEKVARGKGEKREGIYFDDSDVYKAIEAIACSLYTPDPALESKVDNWIVKIAAAQLPDSYLNTYFTLSGLDHRWTGRRGQRRSGVGPCPSGKLKLCFIAISGFTGARDRSARGGANDGADGERPGDRDEAPEPYGNSVLRLDQSQL